MSRLHRSIQDGGAPIRKWTFTIRLFKGQHLSCLLGWLHFELFKILEGPYFCSVHFLGQIFAFVLSPSSSLHWHLFFPLCFCWFIDSTPSSCEFVNRKIPIESSIQWAKLLVCFIVSLKFRPFGKCKFQYGHPFIFTSWHNGFGNVRQWPVGFNWNRSLAIELQSERFLVLWCRSCCSVPVTHKLTGHSVLGQMASW